MAGHTSEKRWTQVNVNGRIYEGISDRAQAVLSSLLQQLLAAEEAYQQMQEIYIYSGGTDTDLAAQLFKEDIIARGGSTPTIEEIAMVNDIIAAMLSAHQLYQAADNVAIAQADRLTNIRRMV